MNVNNKGKRFNNNIIKNSQNNENKELKDYIPCSIKPNYLIIPKDINMRKIFLNMLKNSKNDINYYKSLTRKEKFKRFKYIEIIKNFIIYHKIKNSIFLNTIFLLDILISKNNNEENNKNNIILNLEQLSLGALILSIKFNYNTYYNFSNKNFKYFNKKEYSSEELLKIEVNCLILLDYNLNYIQPINYIELFFLNGIVFTNDIILTKDSTLVYNNVLILLEEVMKINNLYLKYNSFHISCSIISFCRKKFLLEKWPQILSIIFNINYNDFENTFNIIKEYDKNLQIKNEYYNNKYFSGKINTTFYNKMNRDKNIKFNLEEKKEAYFNNKTRQNQNQIKEFSSDKKLNNYQFLFQKYCQSFVNTQRKNIDIFNNTENKNQDISIFKNYNKKYLFNNDMNESNLFNYKIAKKEKIYNVKITKQNIKNINDNSVFNKTNNSNLNNEENNKNERRKYSLEHYKNFHINLNKSNIENKNIPLSILEKKVRNLSQIINHLYSNHTNNIL